MMDLKGLSERDKEVLRSILCPTGYEGIDLIHESDVFLEQDVESDSESWKTAQSLCRQGIDLAEGGKTQEALSLLEAGVKAAPNRADGYNNRAQLFRMLHRDDEAMFDLEKALQLTAGRKTKARAQALCQKGVLLRKQQKDDEARPLFAEAAKLGSSFAKQQVVELNPCAALCNQIVSQVMRGETDIKL